MICHYLRLCRVLKLLYIFFFLIMPERKFCKSSPLYKDQSFKDDAEVDVLIDAAILNKNFKSLSFFEKLVKSSINNHLLAARPNAVCIDLRMHSYVLDADGVDIPPPDLVSSSSFSSLPTPSSSSKTTAATTIGGVVGATTHSSVLIDGQSRGKAYLYPLLETIRDAGLRGYQFSIAPASNGTRGCFERIGRSIKAIPRIIHQSWKVCNK